jgi:two-component system sensor histidine kinase/response regulator
LNLAGNAVKFTERGEVVVKASLVRWENQLAILRFDVIDTGPGIAPDNQRRLFQSFSQGDASSTRRHGGSGLGLAISKRLTELMGGTIGLSSEIGKGSTFWVTLPFEVVVKVDDDDAESRKAMLRGLRVLVIDDNETNRKIFERTLLSWGMAPTMASSAEEGLRLLREAVDANRPFAVALSDYAMPGMDGIELIRRIASDPVLASARRALLTSTGERGDLTDTEVDAFLTKPVRQSALFDCIAGMVGKQKRAPSVRPVAPTTLDRSAYRLLLAEDNPVNQTVARRMLESIGFAVDVVSNGLEAVDAAASHPYSVIFMDCQMPEMDGYEATEELRRREVGQRRTPIVAMTASAMQGDAERCFQSGMDDYLAKPVRVEELEATVLKWIDGNRSQSTDDVVTVADDRPSPIDVRETPAGDGT